ncbi:hypothetical protein V1460_35530 [Streptomyces sp. SCSIO 30461]|uniref:hypothetical protein n=1 Tax=Streptomyces sp. SCSIO 30461 TaxID=3118085 RepID=UPI0030D5112C
MTTRKAAPLSGVEHPESRPGIGDVAEDADTGRVGLVMGQLGGRVQMRPIHGGVEWDAMPEKVTTPTAREELSVLPAVNSNSRARL